MLFGAHLRRAVESIRGNPFSATSAKYPTHAAWSAAMNSFSSAIAEGMHAHGQKLWCNKGDSRSVAGSAAWRALDASPSHPEVLLKQGAFAVSWGAAVQFEPERKNQVDVLGAITNSNVALLSHTQLSPGQRRGQRLRYHGAFEINSLAATAVSRSQIKRSRALPPTASG